jgi:hypothetical protein
MALWIGIDEAGYGPNLGPLVMTAVIAEGPAGVRPDPWADLAPAVARAGGDPSRLWIDDSKKVYASGKSLDRLEAAALAAVAAATGETPCDLAALLRALEAGTPADVELEPWLDGPPPPVPRPGAGAPVARALDRRPLEGAPWRIVGARSVVVGPARFNAGLDRHGSKAAVHFDAFARLLRRAWDDARAAGPARVRGDKHGGRHFYLDALASAFPGTWIDRGPEGPDLSRYTLRDGDRRLDLDLLPRADADDGLVALASLVSKYVRERWMDIFNRYWCSRIPGLRPTAGYPADAARFRLAIGPHCGALGLEPACWWRAK